MSFLEVVYRVQHKIREKIDKQFYLKCSPDFEASSQIEKDKIFLLSRDVSRKKLQDRLVATHDPLRELADSYCRNQYDIFGIKYDYGDRVDWHLDPKTGNRWPLKFWSEVDIRDGFTIGGPKFVWEANRLYCLNTLGMAYRLTGERKYAAKIFNIIAAWMQANPYALGVNWTSGIELSIRVVNLLWAVSFLEGREFSAEENKLVSHFCWLHGRHLYRYPSKYSSNNNHAIAEAFVLFFIGVYFSGFAESPKWLTFGKKVLEREVARQILPDGGSYENTTTYLSFVFDFFLLFKLVCDNNDIDYDPILDKRLEQSCEFIYSLVDINGNIANIGDQDSAILVNFGLDNHENFQSILNTGALLFNRPEYCRSDFTDFKTWVLLGDIVKSKDCESKDNPDQSRLFKESGLAVIRQEVKEQEVVFTGNATPLGMPPLYAHGHLDALSICLSVGGMEILVDPGTYLYHSGGKWRRYFRSTAAHNTVRINERDMTEQVADFMFGSPYTITKHSLKQEGQKTIWRAAHDAYQRLKVPLTHERQVIFDSGKGTFELVDMLSAEGDYLAEQFFHFHPGCTVFLVGNTAKIHCSNVTLTIAFDSRLEVESFKGSSDPLLGWYSDRFNNLEECWTVVGRIKCRENKKLITEIIL